MSATTVMTIVIIVITIVIVIVVIIVVVITIVIVIVVIIVVVTTIIIVSIIPLVPKNGNTSSFFSIRTGPGGVLTASRGHATLCDFADFGAFPDPPKGGEILGARGVARMRLEGYSKHTRIWRAY